MEIIDNFNNQQWHYNEYFQIYNDAEKGYIIGKIVKSVQEDFGNGASWIPVIDKTDEPKPFYYILYTTPDELMKTFYSDWDNVDKISSEEVANILSNQEHWKLGDVLVSTYSSSKGLIVKNSNGKYCLMDIDPDGDCIYSTNEGDIFGNSQVSLDELYQSLFPTWHKVNAKLVIE